MAPHVAALMLLLWAPGLWSASAQANVCSCSNGQAATGVACTTHSTEICASCDAGFHTDGDPPTCQANTCTCTDGSPAAGVACTTDNSEICASCNAGYDLNGTVCQTTTTTSTTTTSTTTTSTTTRTCTCTDGTAATGHACLVDNTEQCATCNEGFGLDHNSACKVAVIGVETGVDPCCTYGFVGAGYCHGLGKQYEFHWRIDSWVSGGRADAEIACNANTDCKGFHFDKEGGQYVLLTGVGAWKKDMWGTRECWKKLTQDGVEVDSALPMVPLLRAVMAATAVPLLAAGV